MTLQTATKLPFASNSSGGAMAETTDGHEELVKVFDTDEESEAMVVRGLLESAGIEAMIQNREAPQDILPGVGGVVILVRPDQAEEAVETIEQYRDNPTTDADEALSEEPV
jgi:hypothetical protein